jgi:SEC-C motif-containing protein
MTIDLNPLCPCGQTTQKTPAFYHVCCAPYHKAHSIPLTPEQLMRSRYSAFVMQEYMYLIQTHHPDYLNGLTVEMLAQSDQAQWLSLQVLSTKTDGNSGEVCFQAWYRDGDDIDAIHEYSQFLREDGKWLYTQGEMKAAVNPKRNDPCICNSGKKFKQCCLK